MAAEAKQKPEPKEKKEKKAPVETPPGDAPAAAAPKPPPAPRQPSDPRLKIMKQLRAKLLPKGDLRDRYKAILQRWESGDDHGGVTVGELEVLFEDRKSVRATGRRRKR